MKLSFIDYEGKTIILDVEPSDNILDVRRKLFDLTGRFDNIELGETLIPVTDNKLIKDYLINEQSSLKLSSIPDEAMLESLESHIIQSLGQILPSSCVSSKPVFNPHQPLALPIQNRPEELLKLRGAETNMQRLPVPSSPRYISGFPGLFFTLNEDKSSDDEFQYGLVDDQLRSG